MGYCCFSLAEASAGGNEVWEGEASAWDRREGSQWTGVKQNNISKTMLLQIEGRGPGDAVQFEPDVRADMFIRCGKPLLPRAIGWCSRCSQRQTQAASQGMKYGPVRGFAVTNFGHPPTADHGK